MENIKKHKILLTGAVGFIGFHSAIALHKAGHDVIGYDNYSPYYDLSLKKARECQLQKLLIPIIQGDIREKGRLKAILSQEKITHVLHLAAQAGVRHSLTHPEEYVYSNLEGFVSLLEACRHFPDIHIVYASSSSVYGLNEKTPFSTEDPTDRPANLYGATKKANELIAHSYHHLYHLSLVGLRFFTVYGPWGRPDMAYYSFTKKIIENTPIDLYNHGMMKRDFTYIDDIVSGILAALEYRGHEIFNLGNNKPCTLFELVHALESALQKKAILNMVPFQKGEVLETYADIKKSQEKLSFDPKTSLVQGIQQFVSWYQEYHKI